MNAATEGVWSMTVRLAGGPSDGKVCVWFPDQNHSVFPDLLRTKDGDFYRCTRPVNSQDEIKPQDELLYLFEEPSPRPGL
jgi:hypothetical protein